MVWDPPPFRQKSLLFPISYGGKGSWFLVSMWRLLAVEIGYGTSVNRLLKMMDFALKAAGCKYFSKTDLRKDITRFL
jgi:hypothetical protein